MPDRIGVQVTGLDTVMARLQGRGPGALAAMARELTVEAEEIMTAAKAITPVETGALRASGHVTPAVIEGEAVTIDLGFGGPAAPYAVYVHERPEPKHKPPTQWKFLEQPAVEAAAGIAGRIAGRLSL